MWGIMVRNRGMWGITTWCTHDDKIELYATKEEAQKVAEERNNSQKINKFSDYFAKKYN